MISCRRILALRCLQSTRASSATLTIRLGTAIATQIVPTTTMALRLVAPRWSDVRCVMIGGFRLVGFTLVVATASADRACRLAVFFVMASIPFSIFLPHHAGLAIGLSSFAP